MAAQVGDAVGFLLPDPQKLPDAGFPIRPPQRHDREFLLQVIPVDHAEFLDRMGRRAVIPMGAHLQIGIPDAMVQNFPASCAVNLVCFTHKAGLLFRHFFYHNKKIPGRQAEKPAARRILTGPLSDLPDSGLVSLSYYYARPFLTWRISARMAMAISGGVSPPRSRPMGVWTAASWASVTPCSRSMANSASIFLRLPSIPT